MRGVYLRCMADSASWALACRAHARHKRTRMQAVEDMCLHRMADRLYSSLQRECDAHIGRQLAGLAAAGTADPTIFLQQVGSGVQGT